jgi:hypothetical protein
MYFAQVSSKTAVSEARLPACLPLVYSLSDGSPFLLFSVYRVPVPGVNRPQQTLRVASAIRLPSIIRHNDMVKVKVSRYRPKQALGDPEG